LPDTARVTVAELNSVVVDWCRGPLAALTSSSLSDPRVRVEVTDVNHVIRRAAADGAERFDAIVLDLYTGPHAGCDKRDDPFYGSVAIDRMKRALAPGGVLAIWGEAHDAGYEKRLSHAGLRVSRHRPGHGGLRHVVYLARRS
jgi:spermidine synthase